MSKSVPNRILAQWHRFGTGAVWHDLAMVLLAVLLCYFIFASGGARGPRGVCWRSVGYRALTTVSGAGTRASVMLSMRKNAKKCGCQMSISHFVALTRHFLRYKR